MMNMVVAVAMAVVTMVAIVTVAMMMVMTMMMIMRVFDCSLTVAAAADRTHQSTSNSLTRISSPPVTCN